MRNVLFFGTSVMHYWPIARHFPYLPYILSGHPGYTLPQLLKVLELLPTDILRPCKTVVVYAGDNDLQAGLPVSHVVELYCNLVNRLKELVGGQAVLLISVRPSIVRSNLLGLQQELNRQLEANYSACWINVCPVVSLMNGEANPKMVLSDGLHPNRLGYRAMSELLRTKLYELRLANWGECRPWPDEGAAMASV